MLVDKIIAHEQGDLDLDGTIELFAELIKTGQAWTLQGHYGRTAHALIECGFITRAGEPQWDVIQDQRTIDTRIGPDIIDSEVTT